MARRPAGALLWAARTLATSLLFYAIVPLEGASTAAAAETTTVSGITAFVTSFTPSRLRQDFSGWVGMTVRIGPSDVQAPSLGRWVVNGNTGAHRVKLVAASTGVDVPGPRSA